MKIKKLLALVLTLAMVISMLVMPASAAGLTDIGSHWAKDSIQRWVDGGILKGYADGTFKADNPIKRSEFAHILVQTLGLTGTSSTTFNDVPDDHWAKASIYACAANGIVGGYADGTFKPENFITRLEAMKMFVVAMQMNGGFNEEEAKAFLTESFDDASAITWGHAYAATMVGYGAMQGSGNYLNPTKNITRGEAATILDRLLAVYVSKDGAVSTTTKGQVDKEMMCNIVAVHPAASAKIVTGETGEISVTVGETVVETKTLYEWTPYVLCGTEGDWAHDCEVTVDKGEMDQLYYYEHHLIAKEIRNNYYPSGEGEEMAKDTTVTEYFYDEETWQVNKVVDTYSDGSENIKTADFDEEGRFIKGYSNDVLVLEYVYEGELLVEEKKYNDDGSVYYHAVHEYNEQGLMIKSSREDRYTTYVYEYEYNSNGEITVERYYNDDRLSTETTYTYDNTGELLKIVEVGYSFVDTTSYKRSEEVTDYKNGRESYYKKTVYSIDGQVEKVQESIYEYDENNHLVRRLWNVDGQLDKTFSYIYDSDGYRTSYIVTDFEGKELNKELYTYERTDNGYTDRTDYYEYGEFTRAYENGANWDTNEYWYREYQMVTTWGPDDTETTELQLVYEHYSIGKEVDAMWVESFKEQATWGKWDGEIYYYIVKLPSSFDTDYWYHNVY